MQMQNEDEMTLSNPEFTRWVCGLKKELYFNQRNAEITVPTTPFSLVLRKEYFHCSQRDSQAVHYI